MPFNRGDLIIGDFTPSKVLNVEYDKTGMIVTCASEKKPDGSYPIDEVIEIQTKVIHGYDNTNVLQGGTVLQSFSSDDILYVSDGFETFIGVVTDVDDTGDQFRDDLIIYQIKIAKYIPPKESVGYTELPDGDETIFDDDWEEGYEEYNNPCGIGRTNISTSINKYIAGASYPELEVYTLDEDIRSPEAPYDPEYGWLVTDNRHQFPYNLPLFTLVFDLGDTYKQAIFDVGYGSQGNQVIGEFGEVIYTSPTQVQPAKLKVNDIIREIQYINIGGQLVYQRVPIEINSDHLVLSVNAPTGIFMIQGITLTTQETSLPVECTDKDIITPVYQQWNQMWRAKNPYRNL